MPNKVKENPTALKIIEYRLYVSVCTSRFLSHFSIFNAYQVEAPPLTVVRLYVKSPMNQNAEDLMIGVPSPVSLKQLRELNILVVDRPKE